MPETTRRIHFVADRGDARLRLDQILVRRLVHLARTSRSRAQEWIESGSVLVDGTPALRSAARVREGAGIQIVLPESALRRAAPDPEEASLEVLYEDDHLMAIAKPPGVVVHPAYKHASGTVLNAVLGRLAGRDDVRPGIVTRLDKETSGVLLIALTPGIHARLQRVSIEKHYLTIVKSKPRPSRGTIELPLGRDDRDRRRVAVVGDGIPAATMYEVLSSSEELTLIRCELITGRTHQIRVHLASRGWPIAGDPVYGVADDRINRVALHSWRVRFPHPVSGTVLDIAAPLPSDFRGCLAKAGIELPQNATL